MPPKQSVHPPDRIPEGLDFEVAAQSGAGRVVIRLAGELDLVVAELVAQRLEHAVTTAHLVVLDLRGLSFIDSSGLSALTRAGAHARDSGCRLVLVRGSVQVDQLLRVTGLDNQFEMAERVPAVERVPSR